MGACLGEQVKKHAEEDRCKEDGGWIDEGKMDNECMMDGGWVVGGWVGS